MSVSRAHLRRPADTNPVTVRFGEPKPAPHAAGCTVKGIYTMDLPPNQALPVSDCAKQS